MKILFVTSSPLEANTSVMISNIALLEGFKSLGHEITFISFKSYDNKKLNTECFKGVKLIRIEPNQFYARLIKDSDNSSLKKNIKRIIMKYTRLIYHNISLYDNYKNAIKNLGTIELDEDYDLMISFSDPKSSHLLGLKIYNDNKNKIKTWFQHWGDPMTIDITRKSKLPAVYVEKQEEMILEKANKVIYVSPFTCAKQIEMFPVLKEKIKFIPLAYRNENKHTCENIIEKDEIVFGYYGSSNSRVRNIIPLYKAFEDIQDKSLKIVGDTDLELLNTNNITIHSKRKSPNDIEIEEKNTDILIVLGNKIGTQIPGKIFYYAGTNKPILVILESTQKELWEYLSKLNRFILCENNKGAIRNKILNIRSEIIPEQLKPLDDFAPRKIAMDIIELID